MSPPESGECAAGESDPSLADCLRLLEEVPAAAASSPAFRRHWPSISASLATLSTALSSPAFPPAAPILAPLAAALSALLSVAADATGPRQLGHLHTVSLLSSSAAALSQLAADARLLAAPGGGRGGDGAAAPDGVISRLRMGSAASRSAALEELVAGATETTLPASAAAAAVSAVAALLDSNGGDVLPPATRERAVSVLAALVSASEPARRALAQESGAVVPHLCRALETSSGTAAAEHACAALLPVTAASRDAAAAVAARGGVAALLGACASGTPAAQAAAAGVLRNVAAFPDLVHHFRDEEGAVAALLRLVALGTPRAREQALGCLRNLTGGGDGDEAQLMKVEAFQEGALACVRDFLDTAAGRGDEPGLAPALGLLRNMASFRYIAEIAVSASFVSLVAAALGSADAATRAEAALALAELCCNCNGIGKAARRELPAESVVPRLVWMLEAKSVAERDAAARALAALVGASSCYRKLFRKDERGVVNAVQLLDPASGVDRRFPVSVLLAVAQSRRCRKQMVAAGACGFVQSLVAAEVDGAKKLAECLGKGKMLGVFPRT